MLLAYTSAFTSSSSSSNNDINSQDPIPTLYYSILLTTLTILVAIIIGTIQFLTLALNIRTPANDSDDQQQHLSKFWNGVVAAGDHFDIIGGSIVGMFILTGILGVISYKPWRRWMDGRHPRQPGGYNLKDSHDDYDDGNNPERGFASLPGGKDNGNDTISVQILADDKGNVSREQQRELNLLEDEDTMAIRRVE